MMMKTVSGKQSIFLSPTKSFPHTLKGEEDTTGYSQLLETAVVAC